jgi:hypothetical protein
LSGTRKAIIRTTATPITSAMISAVVLPPVLRKARIAKTSRIHSRLTGTSTFQPSRMNWS